MLLSAQLAEKVIELGFKFDSVDSRELGTERLEGAFAQVYDIKRGSLAKVTYDVRTGNTESKINEYKLKAGEKSVNVMAATLKRDGCANNIHLQIEQEIEHPTPNLTLIY